MGAGISISKAAWYPDGNETIIQAYIDSRRLQEIHYI